MVPVPGVVPLLAALNAYAQGEDWKPVIEDGLNQPDYNQEFEKNPISAVAQRYAPKTYAKKLKALEAGEITQEDFDEWVDDSSDDWKEKFNQDKKILDKKKQDYVDVQKKIREDFQKSVTVAEKEFKEMFPAAKPTAIEKFRRAVASKEDLLDALFDNKGNLKAGAGQKIALMLFGDKFLPNFAKQERVKARTEAAADFLKTTDKKKKPANQGKSKGRRGGDDETGLEFLNGGSPYDSRYTSK